MPSPSPLAIHHLGRGIGVAPTVVLVHGWPDSAAVWDPVAERLGASCHVVTVDLPGVGESLPPSGPRPYRLAPVAAELDAAIRTFETERGVHLVGHDWGGVLGWEFAMTPAFASGIRSFTTLSGPSLDHLGLLARRAVGDRETARVVGGQLARSWYTAALSVPVLRTAIWRLGADRAFRAWLGRTEGVVGYPGDGVAHDAVAAVPLYRSNIVPRLLFPRARPVTLPVQVVVAERDRYVSPAAMRSLELWIPQIEYSSIDAGHWSPRSHPDAVAGLVAEWVQRLS